MRWQALDAAGTTPASAALAAEDLSDPRQPGPKVITARTLTTDGLQLPTGSWVGHELVGYAVALLLQFYILLLSHTVTNPSAR